MSDAIEGDYLTYRVYDDDIGDTVVDLKFNADIIHEGEDFPQGLSVRDIIGVIMDLADILKAMKRNDLAGRE